MDTVWEGKKELEFLYTDSKSRTKRRHFILRRVQKKGTTYYLKGYSLLRNSSRTFRAERICSEVVDLETGEAADTIWGLLNLEDPGPSKTTKPTASNAHHKTFRSDVAAYSIAAGCVALAFAVPGIAAGLILAAVFLGIAGIALKPR